MTQTMVIELWDCASLGYMSPGLFAFPVPDALQQTGSPVLWVSQHQFLSLNPACCTSPVCPGLRNQSTVLPLMIPNWNNPANESLEVSSWGLCNVSAGAAFVYTLPVSSFTNFKKHIDKFPRCFGSASINHPTNSTNISPGLL